MTTSKTAGRLLSVSILVMVFAWPLGAEILERILVKVNGEIITKTELEERQIAFLRQRNVQVDLSDDAELKRVLGEITPVVLAEAIDEMLLLQRGRELGYRLTDDQYRNMLETIKQENNIETEEQFQAALQAEGMTMADLRRALERQMLMMRVSQQEILGRVSITEDEARRYYAAHPEQFATPSTVTLREILIAVPTETGMGGELRFNVGQDDAARRRAEGIRERLLAGEDFAGLASEVSDAPSRANGGLIGPFRLAEVAPAVAEVVEGLDVGEVSQPLRTARGYHLLKLESATPAEQRSFDEVRDEIGDRVFDEKRRAALERYVKRLRAQAIIEWKSDELQKAWEEYVARSPADASPAF